MSEIIWNTQKFRPINLSEEKLKKAFPRGKRYVLNAQAERAYDQAGTPEDQRRSGFVWFGQRLAEVADVETEQLTVADHLNLVHALISQGLIGWADSKSPDKQGWVLYPGKRDSKIHQK